MLVVHGLTSALRRLRSLRGGSGLVRVLLGIAALGALASACAGARPDSLGSHESHLAPCPSSPNCVSTAATSEQHGLAAFVLAREIGEAWPDVEATVIGLAGCEIITSTPGYLHAECTSRLMRYVDDLEIRAPADGDRLEVRSASRVGYGDMGVNRARADALRAGLVERGVVWPGS